MDWLLRRQGKGFPERLPDGPEGLLTLSLGTDALGVAPTGDLGRK